jgi:RNA polymerase sigma factor (sigma-70 family)
MGADAGSGEGNRDERFDACFEAHFEEIFAFARRRTENLADAEDLAAETFAVAWRRAQSIPDPSLPWLYGVANGVLRNQRRSSRRRWRLLLKLDAEPTVFAPDPAEYVGEMAVAAAAFARLSESHREVLRLVAWEGLDPSEAATALGCSASAFRVRLHRARQEMAKQLELHGHVRDEGETAPPTASPQQTR